MDYIVLDMEWNQPFSKNKKIAGNTLLKGEIIQIGAIKMNDGFEMTGSFNESIKPVFYKTINRHVREITGLTTAELKNCDGFKEVFNRFSAFCGDNYCLITWGNDDMPMLRDNMDAHGLDASALPKCYNLQSIFNSQISHESRQWSLSSAMEKLEIEQMYQPHDALSDAVNTAIIASKLDMQKGIEQYGKVDSSGISYGTLISSKSRGMETLIEAIKYAQRIKTQCPFCKNNLTTKGWIGKRNKRIALGTCKEHGTFKFQTVIYKTEDLYFVKRKVTYASEDMKKSYAEKTEQALEI